MEKVIAIIAVMLTDGSYTRLENISNFDLATCIANEELISYAIRQYIPNIKYIDYNCVVEGASRGKNNH